MLQSYQVRSSTGSRHVFIYGTLKTTICLQLLEAEMLMQNVCYIYNAQNKNQLFRVLRFPHEGYMRIYASRMIHATMDGIANVYAQKDEI